MNCSSFAEQQVVHIADEIVVAQVHAAPPGDARQVFALAVQVQPVVGELVTMTEPRLGRSSEMTMSALRRDRCSMRGSASRSMDKCGCLRSGARCGARISVPKPGRTGRAPGPLCWPRVAGARVHAPSTADPWLHHWQQLAPARSGGGPAMRRKQRAPIRFSSAWMRRATVVCSTPTPAAPARVPVRASSRK